MFPGFPLYLKKQRGSEYPTPEIWNFTNPVSDIDHNLETKAFILVSGATKTSFQMAFNYSIGMHHSNSGLVRYSESYCIAIGLTVNDN